MLLGMAQLLPKNDSLAEGATHYGQKLAGYIRLRPWTSDASTGYAIPTQVGHLHSGYFNLPAGTGVPGRTSTPAAFTASGSSTGQLCAALWRPYEALRCTATLACWLYITTGVYNDTFRYAGVTVRNQGGSYDDTAGVEAISSSSGYWFLLVNDAGAGGAKWLLLRVNSGTVTVLAQAAHTLTSGQVGKTLILNLQVAGSSGNVVLTPTYDFQGAASPIGGSSPTNPFGGAITDSSGSKLTSAGRCGFGLSRERVQSSPSVTRSAHVADYFQIEDTDSGAAVLVDEWQRAALTGCTAVSGELNGKNGRMLSSLWGADVAGTSALKLKRDAGNDRVEADAAGIFGAWSQRPADDIAAQHRKVIARWATSSNQRSVGIQLRGTNLHDPTNRACYNAEIRRTAAGAWEARIYDQRLGYTSLAVATGLGSLGLDIDLDLPLEFQVENANGVDSYSGEVHLIVRANDVVIDNWTSAPSGVEIQSSGLVIDRRSARILTGPMEGLEIALLTSTDRVYLSEWEQVSSLVTTPGESAQASIAVSTETDGATGTLTLPRGWSISITKRARRARHVFASRHVGRVAMDTSRRRTWTVHASPCSQLERADLATFYDSHKGVEVPFNWTTPDGEAVIAAFVDPRLAVTLRAPIVRELEFDLEERA